jgi:hypothetical protein
MISRVHSSILQGIDAIAGEVEVDVARGGLGELKLVGLAETAVKESVSRIQAALRNSGYRWPGPKVTINLAPADVKKDSGAFGCSRATSPTPISSSGNWPWTGGSGPSRGPWRRPCSPGNCAAAG